MQDMELAHASRSRNPASSAPASKIMDRLTLEIAAYTKVINAREAALKELKRRRRSLITEQCVRRLHTRPDVQARRVAALRALYQKPETLAKQSARSLAVHQRKGTSRPKMTPEEFKEYRRLLRKMPRPDVIKLMGLPT